MSGHAALAFDQLLVSRQFVDDLDDIARNDPGVASKVARTICNAGCDSKDHGPRQ